MPQPYPIADERAIVDAINNANYASLNALPIGGQAKSTVAASAALNTTETVISPVVSIIPGQTLQVGSRIRVCIEGTSTATVANITTFNIRMGILGTVSDAVAATYATTASGTTGTAVPFHVEIELVVRTLGATGTGAGSMTLTANAATAIGGAVTNVVPAASVSIPTTTATFIEVSHVTAATTTTNTFQNVTIEVQP